MLRDAVEDVVSSGLDAARRCVWLVAWTVALLGHVSIVDAIAIVGAFHALLTAIRKRCE